MSLTSVTSTALQNSTVDNSPIGSNTPSSGIFTTLVATGLAQLESNLTCLGNGAFDSGLTAPTVTTGDNSTNAATTAWVRNFFGANIVQLDSQTLQIGPWQIKTGIIASMGGGDSNPNTVNFTNPFPTGVLGYGCATSGANDRITYFSTSPSNSGFVLNNNGSGAGASWFVIGH